MTNEKQTCENIYEEYKEARAAAGRIIEYTPKGDPVRMPEDGSFSRRERLAKELVNSCGSLILGEVEWSEIENDAKLPFGSRSNNGK